jgi:hypothetical protein
MSWELIIGLAAVGVMWVASEPTIRLRMFLFKKDTTWWFRLLECAMCSSFHIYFWYKLFVYHDIDIIGASLCGILSELIYQKLNKTI